METIVLIVVSNDENILPFIRVAQCSFPVGLLFFDWIFVFINLWIAVFIYLVCLLSTLGLLVALASVLLLELKPLFSFISC